MTNNRERALNNSLSTDNGDEIRSETPAVKNAGVTGRPPRSTAGWARRNVVRTAVTSAIVAMGVLGVGVVGAVGEASAKPMERDAKRYCAKLYRDVSFTIDAYHKAVKSYGEDNALTRQAGSNAESAINRYADSDC